MLCIQFVIYGYFKALKNIEVLYVNAKEKLSYHGQLYQQINEGLQNKNIGGGPTLTRK